MNHILNFYRTSRPSVKKVSAEKTEKTYKRLRMSTFIAATLGYSLYYVCRTSLNVVKQPIIDSGFLDAGQLGIIGSCLLAAYAIGKFVNGFLADYCNARRFMATGLIISALANLTMGILGIWSGYVGITGMTIFIVLAIVWALNGWSQSMGVPPAIVSLSRWFPLSERGSYYGFFSASHNFGEGLSYLCVGLIVTVAGWQWGFFGSALAGALGVATILLFLHDTPESEGLPSIEVLSGEKQNENKAEDTADASEVRRIQKAVLRSPGVWILAAASAFMYISRYAVNGWGVLFLQKIKGFDLATATVLLSVNAWCGVVGTVVSGWFSDKLFHGDRKIPALIFGALNTIALVIFLYGGNGLFINILAMILFGIAIGVLICFLGGLMAVDLVPRKASGAALGIVGIASYAAAALQDIISGQLIDKNITEQMIDGQMTQVYDFGPASMFWIGASIISFLLPILNWNRKQEDI
ncbi:MAG: MFS transporter [Candidatus Cryptobacteroides sp.]